ncbi:helix-turn-helix domain-containing protein [Streptomyces sp. NPDC005485]|uniref:AraC-like ligand-binding domain-containing protein n=1 Tax=Streptomyces sp. NPDC005485 TaxID=3155591 RepID=UPI0033A08A8C
MPAITVSPRWGGGTGLDVTATPRSQVLSTHSVPRRESLAYWHDAVLATLVGMDIFAEGGTYNATMRTDQLGDLQIITVDCDPGEVYRAPRFIARGDGEQIFVALQDTGIAQVEQDGRSTELHPGDVSFYETIRPFRTRYPQRFRMRVFAVPRRLLGQSEADLQRITARALRPTAGLAAVLSPFMARLADTCASYSGAIAHGLGSSAVNLLAAVAQEQLGKSSADGPGTDQVLLLRVQTFIRWHLSDPDLTPAVIARAHQISVRYLHRLFENEGTTVCRWIRELRFEECRRELASPGVASAGIGAVARRWGFTSATHFSRVFRSRYGMPPTEWLLRERTQGSREEDRCPVPSH